MVRDARKTKQNLQKKGFNEEQGAKHILYKFEPDGIITGIQTKMSRNNQDLDDYLLEKMKKQVKLDNMRDFLGLIDCPLSKENYIEILKSKNLLEY